MCKAHSKVTHIKQQKYFHHLKGRGYNKNSVLYPGRFRWWKYFRCFICVTLLWALHIVIKQQFFTFIFYISSDFGKINRNFNHKTVLMKTTMCSKKHVTTFLMISWSRTVRLQRFLVYLLLREYAIDRCFIFPPHLFSAATLPWEIVKT